MPNRSVIGYLAAAGLQLLACSSENDILPKRERFPRPNTDSGASSDAWMDAAGPAEDSKKPRDPEANCVKPGTPSNERGVGGYCELGGAACNSDAGPRFCTADFGEIAPVPDNLWFCSTVCSVDSECGSGAICSISELATACVPLVCIPDASAL